MFPSVSQLGLILPARRHVAMFEIILIIMTRGGGMGQVLLACPG